MEASADATLSTVLAWLDERQEDDRLLARRATSSPAIFGAASLGRVRDAELSQLISNVAAERGYRGIWLLRADGSMIVTSAQADSLPPEVRSAAILVARNGKTGMVGPIPTPGGQLFAVIEPVTGRTPGRKTSRLGTVILGVDPYQALYPTVLREQGGLETPRHRLVQHIDGDFVVLTPSRVPAAAPGKLRIPWARTPPVGIFAASGKDTSGTMIGIDGTRIIAATRHISETHWGIIRALEEREALAPVEREFRLDELFAGTVFLIGVLFSLEIRRRQRRTRLVAVAESEARYKLLAEHATDLIMRQDVGGHVLYVSPACRQLLGYEPEELTSVGPLHFVHPDDEDLARNAHETVFRNPLSLPVQYRLRRSDGSYAWFETTGQPVIDPLRHELVEIVTVSRDISSRRAIEEEGKRLALRNALLLESAAEGIVGLDGNGTIIFLNPAGERILGWSAAELLGKSHHAVLHHTRADGTPNSQESCGICMTASTGRGHTSQDEVFWHRGGTSFPVEYQSTPIRESEGVVGAVVTFRDVSARRRANQELVRAKEDAEAANAAKSDFLARMSHELRTPLNSVIGFSNVLRKNKAGNLKSLDLSYLERIGTNGVQLLALINDILDLSKIESGKVTLDLSIVDIGALVRDTLVQLGDRGHKSGVTVEAVIGESMRTIETDAAKLRQVLINLVGNAVKFTHAGSVTVTVDVDRLTNRPTGIRVTDTGIGIAPERMAAVFAAFEQADTSTTREYGGTGLGLSISRALCDLLGFQLDVESVLGLGTIFTIGLSAESALSLRTNDAVALGVAREEVIAETIGDADTPLVLVIEDDADARELLRGHVEELGYRVAMAASGEEGLRMARQLRPHLITLDLMMPGMDGWELLKRLAGAPELAQIPVIIVSAIAGEMQDSFVGAVDWIDKPMAHLLLGDAITRNIDLEHGGVLIVEDDPDARELLKRYVLDDRSGNLRVARDGASALAMLASHLPDLIVLDLKMPYVDGFAFLEAIREDPDLRDIAVIVVTAAQLSPDERAMLAECTIAVLEKGMTLEADLARVLRRVPAPPLAQPLLAGA
jgi:PAS domain S-box-containing protein